MSQNETLSLAQSRAKAEIGPGISLAIPKFICYRVGMIWARSSVVLPFFLYTFSALGAIPKPESLRPGECVSNPSAKNYLKTAKASPNSYKSMIQEIGVEKFNRLADSKYDVYYFCQITCKDPNEKLTPIWVTLSNSTLRENDMDGFQCPLVSIEIETIVGQIKGPQPVAKIYEAAESSLPEVHSWLNKIQFRYTEETYRAKWPEFKRKLLETSNFYLKNRTQAITVAGIQLLEIALETETGKKLLAEFLRQLDANQWQVKLEETSEFYTVSMIVSHGRFLAYRPLPPPPAPAPDFQETNWNSFIPIEP